jgi:predicted transcriptional regulator
MASESYTVRQAASLLGVSDRRVRQMAATGALPIVGEHPTRLEALAVIEERKRRERTPKPEAPSQALDAAQLRELVAAIVADVVPLALEGQRRVEELLRDELAQSRAETAQLRAQLDERKGKGKGGKGAGKGGKGKGKKRKLWGK